MSDTKKITFVDNPSLENSNTHYMSVDVDVAQILESWRDSLFSFQWLSPEGQIKTLEELPEDEQPKRQMAEEKFEKNLPIEKPILGIGIQDNVEIGSGRAEFLTLATHGLKTMPVHIPQSNARDFERFLAN